MDFAGAIAMPLSIFAFGMTMFLIAQVGLLKNKVDTLEKQLMRPSGPNATNAV
jgi:hypothetical protein